MTALAKERARQKIRAELERRGVDIEAELAKRRARPQIGCAEFTRGTVNFDLHEWQERYLCPTLDRVFTEKGLRLALHGPPQYGKSIIVSQRFPALLFGRDPVHRVGLACYNETRATEFGDVVKQIMCSPQYGDMFPDVSVRPDAPAGRFSTVQRARMLDAQPSFQAMGLLSGFVGRGVDTLIIDDPYKSADEARSETINEKVWRWWSETAKVRIAREANVIVMFHRYHEDDFAGRLINEGFEYIRFPAVGDDQGNDPTGRDVGELLSPMRDMAYLDAIKDADLLTFLGMFQGVPRAAEGNFFKADWFRKDAIPPLNTVVRYWDLATSVKQTGDWTASALAGLDAGQRFCLKHAMRFRAEWPDAAAKIVEVTEREANEYGALGIRYVVGVDARLSQQGFVQQLLKHNIFDVNRVDRGLAVPLWADKFTGDKKESASGLAADMRFGRFVMAPDPEWNEVLVKEFLSFTGADTDTDDLVDAVSGAHRLLWDLRGGVKKDERKPEVGSPAWIDKVTRPRSGKGIWS